MGMVVEAIIQPQAPLPQQAVAAARPQINNQGHQRAGKATDSRHSSSSDRMELRQEEAEEALWRHSL